MGATRRGHTHYGFRASYIAYFNLQSSPIRNVLKVPRIVCILLHNIQSMLLATTQLISELSQNLGQVSFSTSVCWHRFPSWANEGNIATMNRARPAA